MALLQAHKVLWFTNPESFIEMQTTVTMPTTMGPPCTTSQPTCVQTAQMSCADHWWSQKGATCATTDIIAIYRLYNEEGRCWQMYSWIVLSDYLPVCLNMSS